MIDTSGEQKILPEFNDLIALLPAQQGTGTELHKLLAELGFREPPNYSCKATMAWMNQIDSVS